MSDVALWFAFWGLKDGVAQDFRRLGQRCRIGSSRHPQMFLPQKSIVTCCKAWIVIALRDKGISPFFGL